VARLRRPITDGRIRQGIDALGDAALRLRQAGDVREHGLVAFRGLRGACLARQGDQQVVAVLASSVLARILDDFMTVPLSRPG
jgi:hypothetical protein